MSDYGFNQNLSANAELDPEIEEAFRESWVRLLDAVEVCRICLRRDGTRPGPGHPAFETLTAILDERALLTKRAQEAREGPSRGDPFGVSVQQPGSG